jgi:hypothetical protein
MVHLTISLQFLIIHTIHTHQHQQRFHLILTFVIPGRPRRRWVDNIRMDLGEVGWGDVDWIGLAQDRNRWRALVNSLLNFRVP